MNDHETCCPLPDAVSEPLDTTRLVEDVARAAKALAHPIRVQIIRILLERDACLCGQIVDQLPVAQATVSQHLKVLRDAGLIRGDIDGPRVCYCVNRAALARHQALLAVLTGTRVDTAMEVLA